MNKSLKYTLELPHEQQCFDRSNPYFNGELK